MQFPKYNCLLTCQRQLLICHFNMLQEDESPWHHFTGWLITAEKNRWILLTTVRGDAEEHPKALHLSRLYSIFGKIIGRICFREKKCVLRVKNLMSLEPKSYSTEVVLQSRQENSV